MVLSCYVKPKKSQDTVCFVRRGLWVLNWDYIFLVERNLRSFYVKEYRLFILVFQDVADFVGLGFTVSAKLIPKLSLLGPELQL